MKNKKVLSMILVLFIAAVVLAGCSEAEIGYYNLIKEVNHLDIFEERGNFSLEIEKIPGSLSDENLKAFKDFTSKYILAYDGKTDFKNEQIIYTFYLKDKASNKKEEITTMIYKEDAFYLKVDKLGTLFKKVNLVGDDSKSIKEFEKVLGSKKYIKISDQDLEGYTIETGVPMSFSTLFEDSLHQRDLFENIMEKGIEDVFKDYESGVIQKVSNNKYKLEINDANLGEFLVNFLKYSINNIEKIEAYLVNIIEELTPREMAQLGLNPQEKEMYITILKDFSKDVKENSSSYLETLNLFAKEYEKSSESFKGSKLIYTLEKTAASSYDVDLNLDIKFKSPDSADELAIKLNTHSILKKAEDFTLKAPDEESIDLSELILLDKKIMNVSLKDGSYSLKKGSETVSGKMDFKVIDGSSYFPLRLIAESFDETVGWEQETFTAYLVRDGEKIVIPGKVFDGRTLVKIREFEKAGYTVDWIQETNSVNIIK